MPFISGSDRRAHRQSLVPYQDWHESDFWEVFDASVGTVIDENLSISGSLNREGWEERKLQAEKLVDDGKIKKSDYMTRNGRSYKFDYDRLAHDFPDMLKTDVQLSEERNAVLAQRRAYAQDVQDRGSGVAQFFGTMSGYMVEPINFLTMPIGTGYGIAKGMGIAGRALLASRNAAVVGAATELAIQPFVYQHKQDIGSPYGAADVIESIGMAALAEGVLGGVLGGIAGYLRKSADAAKIELAKQQAEAKKQQALRKALSEETGEPLPPMARVDDTIPDAGYSLSELTTGINYIERGIELLKDSPRANLKKVKEDFLAEARAGAKADVDAPVSKTEVKRINENVKRVRTLLKSFVSRIPKAGELKPRFRAATHEKRVAEYSKLKSDLTELERKAFSPAKRRKGETLEDFEARVLADDVEFKRQLDFMNRTFNNTKTVKRLGIEGVKEQWDQLLPRLLDAMNQRTKLNRNTSASKIVEMIDAGKVPPHLQGELDYLLNEAQVTSDVEFMKALEETRKVVNQPSRTPSNYVSTKAAPPPASRTTGNLQDWALEERGVKDAYNKTMQEFSEVEEPKMVVEGELVPANAFMKELDDELAGLESIMVCTRG
jgi:hypothetical protein